MSVTQNYKTFKLSASDDAIRYIVAAVMRQLVSDRERVESAKDSALVDFLRRETATGNEALAALNCTSTRDDAPDALPPFVLRVAVSGVNSSMAAQRAHLRAMVDGKRRYDYGVECCPAIYKSDVDRARAGLKEIEEAVVFLESLK